MDLQPDHGEHSYRGIGRLGGKRAHWVFDAGRRAVTVAGELRDEQHCGEVIDRTVQEFGQIDVCTATWPSDVAGRRA
ncbi:MAG: hypothetical protein M3332_06790 [Actinomycetota bacterium]|jgi:hypothetical protein|nr:hypothetical protein [Actinomycetota bacterium]